MGMNEFAPFVKRNTKFVVKNISTFRNKVIRIFHYPIPQGKTRDLLDIKGIGEADIRASLLKGELLHKIEAKEIEVVESDIDLLQFNDTQKLFLQNAGIIKGLEVTGGSGSFGFLFKQNVPLIGVTDGINRTFYTPNKFLNGVVSGNTFKIQVFHNGRLLIENLDYIISESAGIGTGNDMIVITSFIPNSNSKLISSYMTN